MTNASPHEEAQLLARLTVLEHVVAQMVRDNMIISGQSPGDLLGFGEKVKTFLANRTPTGATSQQLNEAADRFFSAIASDMGSQHSQSD
jgi:hypothetical protein